MRDFKPDKKGEAEDSGFFRPFENLRALLESKSLPIASSPPAEKFSPYTDVKPDHPEYEQNLFMAAMKDVKPLSKGKYFEEDIENSLPHHFSDENPYKNLFDDDTEYESILRLKRLVESGEGFVVADTSEYMEGRGYCDNPELTERLHRGEFSMQAYIDLHGLGADAAQDVFDDFIREAILTGKRAVLVIHGRGLSSPARPVLKNKVLDWLTRGPWRKWIIAFSSARLCDGGSGATYVLLRKTPYTKRLRKKKKGRSKKA
jgi:DNA-nicking Smr family endonuclease